MSQKTDDFQSNFIKKIAKLAQEVQATYHVPASLVIAQAIQETGFGAHAPGDNYFGIKGKGQCHVTHECVNGKDVVITAGFTAPGSEEASFLQYGKLLKQSRYAGVHSAPNGYAAADAVFAAGYATDPDYAKHLKILIHKYNLTQYDSEDFKHYTENDTNFDNTYAATNHTLSNAGQDPSDPLSKLFQGLMDMIKHIWDGISGAFNVPSDHTPQPPPTPSTGGNNKSPWLS